MRHVIVTCCDSRYGDFLAQHWGHSLKDNVDLRDIEVVVFDYGMTGEQRSAVEALDFHIKSGRRDGHVVNVRFRDIADWLAAATYDQVLSIDGGDVIFQGDIRHLFDANKDRFRAVCEDVPVQSSVECMDTADFQPAVFDEIYESVKNRPLINGGFLLGPRECVVELYRECCERTIGLRCAGTDQLLVNYRLYQDDFVSLEKKYNFVLLTTASRFTIRQGQFFDDGGELIPVVHNAGMSTRLVKDFGYGATRNRKNHAVIMGRVVWFSLPIRVRSNLANWRRRRRARRTELHEAAKSLPR